MGKVSGQKYAESDYKIIGTSGKFDTLTRMDEEKWNF